MKITQIDSHIEREGELALLVKDYFCVLEDGHLFLKKTEREVIGKFHNSTPQKESPQEPSISKFVAPKNIDKDLNQDIPEKYQKCVESQVLLLFVKADAGNSLISSLKSEKKLSENHSDELYLNTMNIWVGAERDFNDKIESDFSLNESKGDIPQLDFVILQILLPDNIPGYQIGLSSGERIDFFNIICENELPIIRFSNRLNFSVSNGARLSWEK